jgi:hypothetical protein
MDGIDANTLKSIELFVASMLIDVFLIEFENVPQRCARIAAL